MHMDQIAFIQCGIPRKEVEYDSESSNSSDGDDSVKSRDKMESNIYSSDGEDGDDKSVQTVLKKSHLLKKKLMSQVKTILLRKKKYL